MKKIIWFLILFSFVAIAQTSLSVMDYNTADGCVELYYSNPNVDVTSYRITYYKEGSTAKAHIISSSTYSVICGLDDGTYTFEAQALDATLATIDAPAVVSGIEIHNPEIPVAPYPNLTVNDDYSVTITWQKSVNADHYKLEWAQDEYFFYTEVHSKILAPDQTSYTISDLPNGTWYFRMFAYSETGEESSLYYSPPHIVIDRPVKSEIWLPWFTDNDYWESNLLIKLPDNVYTADVEIIVETPDGIRLSKTVNINSADSQTGYAYTYNIKKLFNDLVQNGSLRVFSRTIGVQANMEIIARQSGVVDVYKGFDVRNLATAYSFSGIVFDREYATGNHILAYAIQTSVPNRIVVTVKLSFYRNGYDEDKACVDVGSRSVTIETNTTSVGILNDLITLPAGWGDGYWIATVSFESLDDVPFYCLLSQQGRMIGSDLMFASWLTPDKK